MKFIYAAALFAIALMVLGIAMLVMSPKPPQPELPQETATTTEPTTHIYRSDTYGISFTYPAGYVLSEAERGDGHRGHYAIVLIRQENAATTTDSEGPTAITIDIYQNKLDKLSLYQWLTTTNAINYKQGDGTYASTTVAGTEAIVNRWSGLYEGETTSFLHKDNLVAVSVTYLTPEDQIIKDYHEILNSLQLGL